MISSVGNIRGGSNLVQSGPRLLAPPRFDTVPFPLGRRFDLVSRLDPPCLQIMYEQLQSMTVEDPHRGSSVF